jgi:CRP-like cAMP-binding protein
MGGNDNVPASCFAEVLNARVDLTVAEVESLARLEDRSREVKRGAILQRENEPGGDLFIVRRGMLMSYVLLDDGSRQILRFYFTGDLIGVPGMIYHEAPETIAALVDAEVCPFDKAALSRLFEEHPRIAALILALNQVERVALTDRLAALGRTSAKARVAALILDLRNRMRAHDRRITDSFTMGLTQEEIGDATGLTAVHVNRMLRQLEDDMLIRRENGRMTIRDDRALARAANYVDRYERLELGWLPAAR